MCLYILLSNVHPGEREKKKKKKKKERKKER